MTIESSDTFTSNMQKKISNRAKKDMTPSFSIEKEGLPKKEFSGFFDKVSEEKQEYDSPTSDSIKVRGRNSNEDSSSGDSEI